MEIKAKICILTLGCKVNQYESDSLAKALEEAGCEVVFSLEKADAYVLNTCAVTNEAERKSRNMLSRIIKENPDAKIYVCGCSSQNDPTKFEKTNVVAVYGTSKKYELANEILSGLKDGDMACRTNTEIAAEFEDKYLAHGERTRAVIKIEDGCNNFCSYCLIPYVRGRERSRKLESVKAEVEMQAKWTKEIVFTGINLSAYGKDFNDGTSLKNIALLMRNYPHVRFRFSSLEQDIITEDFLKILSQTPNFCPHFHLSLQSGCDNTLKAMNRHYDTQKYYHKLELIRKYFDNPAITTDVIVGFVNETEEDFETTYEFCKKCKFAKMHIFPYSPRSKTVASRMKNIATNVKERVARLTELDKQMQRDYIDSCVGKTYALIVEIKEGNYFVGHTENYIKCYVEGAKNLKSNQIVRVKIERFYLDGAVAKVISY